MFNIAESHNDRFKIFKDSTNGKDEEIMCELSEHLGMPKRVMGWKCTDKKKAIIPPCKWSGVACDEKKTGECNRNGIFQYSRILTLFNGQIK